MSTEITLSLQTITNVKYEIQVPRLSKIKTVKRKVFETIGISNKLKLLMSKKELEDEKRLTEYQIVDQTVIQMLLVPPENIDITVNVMKKGSVEVTVNDNSTLKELKEELKDAQHDLGSAPRVYDFYDKSGKLKKDDDTPLHLHGICNDYKLDLKSPDAKFKVYADRAEDYTMMTIMEFSGTDTVREMTEKFLEYVNTMCEDSCSSKDIVLFHRPKGATGYTELDRDNLTLDEYGVEPFDRIMYISYKECCACPKIFVDGKTETIYKILNKDKEVNLITLKLKIQNQFGIPVAKQFLTVPGLKSPAFTDNIPSVEDIRVIRRK